jgi:hypothetical protein
MRERGKEIRYKWITGMKEMPERGTTIRYTRDEEASWKKGEEGDKDTGCGKLASFFLQTAQFKKGS